MPSQIALFLPIIAAVVSYLMQQEHWPQPFHEWEKAWLNGIIATLTIVGAVVADLFIQGRLTGSVLGDMLLVGSSTVALQVETYRPLQQWIREIGFPISVSPTFPVKTEPAPIVLSSQEIVPETKEHPS